MTTTGRVSLSEAAERLGVHYMTVYHYVRTGRLAAERQGATWSVALEDLEALRAAPPRRARGAPRVERPARLGDRMVVGDEAGAWHVIEGAMGSGAEPAEVYTEILAPALRRIGERWENGEISVADEHRASVVASRLVGRLGPRFARRGRSRGSVVLGAAPGELHALPGAMLADLLRGAGFEALDLGADVPAASFVETARGADRLVAVLVGATSSGREEALGQVVAALRAGGVSVPILLGGRAVRDARAARRLGGDGWSGADAREALAAVEAAAVGLPRSRG